MRKIFNLFDTFIQNTPTFGTRYPKLILSVSFLIFTVFLLFSSQLHFTVSLHEIVDDKLPGALRLKDLKGNFERGNSVFISFHKENSKLSSEDLKKINNTIEHYKASASDIYRVNSPFMIRQAIRENNSIWFYKLIDKMNLQKLSVLDSSPWKDLYHSSSHGDLLYEIIYDDTKGGTRFGAFDPTPIGDLILYLKKDFSKSDILIDVTGSSTFSFYAFQGIKRNGTLNYLILLLVVFFLKAIFGTFRGGFIILFNLTFMGACVYGLMGLLGIKVDILNSGVFLMLTVAGIEDFIFLSNIHSSNGKKWVNCFKEIAVPSFYTSLTTMIGFGSLYFSDIKVIQDFGIVACFGAFIEWFSLFMLTPALLKLIPSLRQWTIEGYSNILVTLRRASKYRLSRSISIILLLVYLLGAYGVMNLNSVDSPRNMFSKDHPFSIGNKYLNASRSWEGTVSLVFEEDTSRKHAEEIIENVSKSQIVQSIYNPYEGIDYLTSKLNKADAEMIKRDLKLTEIYKRNFSRDGKVRGIIYIKNSYSDQLNKLRETINVNCEKGKYCHSAGELISYSEFSSAVLFALYRSLGSSLLLVSCVIVFLCFRFGQGKILHKILLSSFWGPLLMMTLLWAFQIRINFMTCVFASVLVGLTGDNAIQFIFSGKDKLSSGIFRHAPASILIAIIMCFASLLFLLSAFVPPRIFGILLGAGILLSLIGDIWILDGLTRDNNEI